MLVHARCLDGQLLDAVIHNFVHLLMIQHKSCFQVLVIDGDANVVLDGQTAEDTVAAAVLCDESDSCIHRIDRMLDL